MPRRVLRRAKKLPKRRSDRLRLLRRSLLRTTRKRPAENANAASKKGDHNMPSTSTAGPPSKVSRLAAATVSTDSSVGKELLARQTACSSSSSTAANCDFFPFALLPPHIQKHIFQFLPLRFGCNLCYIHQSFRSINCLVREVMQIFTSNFPSRNYSLTIMSHNCKSRMRCLQIEFRFHHLLPTKFNGALDRESERGSKIVVINIRSFMLYAHFCAAMR